MRKLMHSKFKHKSKRVILHESTLKYLQIIFVSVYTNLGNETKTIMDTNKDT